MAVLTTEQRVDATHQLIRKMFVEAGATATLDTTEVRALIDAADDFIEANASAYNQTIPLAVRTKATLGQKALALALAAMKRGGVI